MNKYCDIIVAVKIYTGGVFSSLKHFTIFDRSLNLRANDIFVTSISVSKFIFTVLLIFKRKKTANGVFFKIVELTKRPLHLTIQNKEGE